MEKAREVYKNLPSPDATMLAKLGLINDKIALAEAAISLFDGFGLVVTGYGLYKQISGENASTEKEVGDVIAKYRADLGGLRMKYEKERDDFLNSQLKKLGQS